MSSKLDKSTIVAGAGLVASIFIMLVKKVHAQGGTDEDIHRLATPDGETTLDEMVALIVGAKSGAFKVVVDYTQTLSQMVQAGNYGWVHDDITQDHFPIKGSGQKEVEVVLFHFDKVITSEEAITEMDKAGFRPARIEELLALGAQQPEFRKKFPIMAPGSVWRNSDDRCDIPHLHCNAYQRNLNLYWFGSNWHRNYRFAAVRK